MPILNSILFSIVSVFREFESSNTNCNIFEEKVSSLSNPLQDTKIFKKRIQGCERRDFAV